jgi:hypothetical protein
MSDEPDLTYDLENQKVHALMKLIAASGANPIEFSRLNDEPPWMYWASANYEGTKITSEHHAVASDALDWIARQVVHGSICVNCSNLMTFGFIDFKFCTRILIRENAETLTYVAICNLDKITDLFSKNFVRS